MSAGGARRGRRDNGLDATKYAVVGDVDPRVGEHLLDVLAAGGIAAYLQPSADLNPITRTTTFPARPTDRLFVDHLHLAIARDYMARLAEDTGPVAPGAAPEGGAPGGGSTPGRDGSAGTPDPDVEAEWARIVAGFHTDVDPTAAPWPAAENLDPTREPRPAPQSDPTRDDSPPRRRASDRAETRTDQPPETGTETGESHRLPSAADFSGISLGRPEDRSLLDGLDTFGAGLPDDADEGYTPPPPPPLPRISKYAAVALFALVGGAVLFLFPDLIPTDRNLVTLVGFAAILGGFGTLVWRLRPGDDDDDLDDGAVV
ncbi:MAG TPA: DUF308 domain-containing protein [Catenuloplanes sp.]